MEENDSIESLVHLACDGDRTAFKSLYERFHRSVFRTAYRLLGNRMLAEDVTQEVVVSIHQKLESFDFNSAFKTWCYRITVNAYDILGNEQYKELQLNPRNY